MFPARRRVSPTEKMGTSFARRPAAPAYSVPVVYPKDRAGVREVSGSGYSNRLRTDPSQSRLGCVALTPRRLPSRAHQQAETLRVIHSFERIAAVLGFVLLAPVAAVLAANIMILSRRSPLVRHLRVGWQGAPLPMLKFRTMWDRTDTTGPRLAIEDVSDNIPPAKSPGDARVCSRFAAFCRRYSLDELPQLYHVARGEMSLVGPRPITRRELDEYYENCADEVLSCRPGITGLWQALGRNRLTYGQRRRLDLWFVRHAAPGLYFRILLRSFSAVIGGRGAC
jgi:exopolysaccharide production protein ExoY